MSSQALRVIVMEEETFKCPPLNKFRVVYHTQ